MKGENIILTPSYFVSLKELSFLYPVFAEDEVAFESLGLASVSVLCLSVTLLILLWYAVTQTSQSARLLNKLPGPLILPFIGGAYVVRNPDSKQAILFKKTHYRYELYL
jgi:hypothetical protein